MRLFLPILLFFSLHSCQSYHSYVENRSNNLTNLNFVPHNNDVELFFAGESEPQKNYVRLALIKETRTGYSAPPGRLLNTLEHRAKQVGADALIVMGTTESSQTFERLADDRVVSIPRNYMWGIAIRYADNLEEGLSILSHLTVETQGEIVMMEGGRIEVDNEGVLRDKVNNKWTEYVHQHSLEYLVDQRSEWSFTRRNPKPGFNSRHLRRHNVGSQNLAKVEVNYLTRGKVGTIGITMLDGLYQSTNMSIYYNDEGQITGREWIDNTNVRYVTTRVYDESGLLIREDYQRQRRGEELAPVLSVTYGYADPTVIEAMLAEEQVVKSKP